MPFTDAQQRTLDAVLDALIPASADGRLPGAGQLALAGAVAAGLQSMPPLEEMVGQGLTALDALAVQRHGRPFADLAAAARAATLDELNAGEHAFPPVLALHAYAGYYQHPTVLAAHGLEPRPPHPRGYETVAGDLTLLEPVRRRGKLYREC